MSQKHFSITKRQLKAALKDPKSTAKVANLVYCKDSVPGIERKADGNPFKYYYNGKAIKDTATLLRIKSLAIPPAWTNVWINPNEDGHLQVTGIDSAGRKQYRYHQAWSKIRSHTKYYRLLEFGLKLPTIRMRVENDLKKNDLSKEKLLATIITILDSAYMRIGNQVYEKVNKSYGLTTLKNKHVKIEGTEVKFCFIGKKGIKSNITIRNRRLANIIRKCKEIPGQHLFGYIDQAGEVKRVDSGMVNEYIRQISDGEFSAKDFRTWAGTVTAIKSLIEIGAYTSQTEMKKNINKMYDMVASELGNTRNVCKNHYIHPIVVEVYEEGRLDYYINKSMTDESNEQLKTEENILIQMLQI